jgi:hypothetical protein
MTSPACFAACSLLLLAPAAHGASGPAATTPHFAFFSDLETNLQDALVTDGLARAKGRTEGFQEDAAQECFAALPAQLRAAWDRAVDYYRDVVSPRDLFAAENYLPRMELSGHTEELTTEFERSYVAAVRGFRAAAAAAYTACRWPAQDAKNRAWIAETTRQLATTEAGLAGRLEKLYESQWSGVPLRVDVVETVNWAGANTVILDRGGGHVLVSAGNPAAAALELVFHEASHTLMGRGAPVRVALAEAAKAANVALPDDLWHAVLFYTTGEAARPVIDALHGGAGYRPMVYDLFERGAWDEHRAALETEWLPYVQGRRSLRQAAAALVATLKP